MSDKLTVIIAFLVGLGLGTGGILLLRSPTSTDSCSRIHGASYSVMVMNGKVEPAHITAHLCDTLTITNMDTTIREVAFGPHEHHVPYDGVAQRELGKDQSLTLTLNQTGTFHWHDHLHDEVQGDFTVMN